MGEDWLKIAAFNVQIFGASKIEKHNVTAILTKILLRYDLIFFQEIRDTSGEAIVTLMEKLNNASAVPGGEYNYLVSERLGRTSSKEQYAWIYKKEKLRAEKAKVMADVGDNFEREPHVVWWKTQGNNYLTTMGIHVKPGAVVPELNALGELYISDVKKTTRGAGALIMGDFNADCTYLNKAEWKCIRSPLCTGYKMSLWELSSEFVWLLDDDVDTTTKSTNCAYDRFVVAGALKHTVLENTTSVYRFDLDYGLSSSTTEDVSDHYPIEVTLDMAKLPLVLGKETYAANTVETWVFVLVGAIIAAVCAVLFFAWRSWKRPRKPKNTEKVVHLSAAAVNVSAASNRQARLDRIRRKRSEAPPLGNKGPPRYEVSKEPAKDALYVGADPAQNPYI